jgi:predicted DNA-binding transcriptional regulator AlpA
MQHKRRKVREFPDITKLPDETLITGSVADALFGHSKATRYRRIAAGTFPKPRKINGGFMARFVLGDIRKQLKADAKAGAQ